MRKLFAILCLASVWIPTCAQTSSAVTRAYADNKGSLHIITADRRNYTIRPTPWQAGGGFEAIKIAPDRRTVGWLADQMLDPLQANSNDSYPVAQELGIWRDGRVIRRFPATALVIWDWIFLNGSKEAAFHIAPPRGQDFNYNCARFDIDTGKQIAHWKLDRRDYVVPDWVKPLLVNDPLPDPEELSKRFPDAPTPTKKTAQPQAK
ncbi:MAG TPA: hypothetical protein VGY94_01785 [Acidobacteriaceae bacterium]|jgi:hypothetical protein|nr:hypothetical protein [Acidobacteriaceae bacterium]